MSQTPAESQMLNQTSELLTECRQLLAAWVELDVERSRLTQSLYSSSRSPEQITSLLDLNDQRRTSLVASSEALLKRLSKSV